MPKTADELALELAAEIARRERDLDALRAAYDVLQNGKRPAGRRASGTGRGRLTSSPGARAQRSRPVT
jgi:hypothetical protein